MVSIKNIVCLNKQAKAKICPGQISHKTEPTESQKKLYFA